jgi:hypothetical protein
VDVLDAKPDTGWPEVGVVWVWIIVMAVYAAYDWWRLGASPDRPSLKATAVWVHAGIPIGLILQQVFPGKSMPVFG